MPSRVLTVMFTDIKGFTERTSQSSREELHNILKEHEDLLPPILKRFGGDVVKTVGDAFMVTFESPTNAVLCGIMIQDRLHERNAKQPEGERLEVRVAINSGEVVERDGDIFGEAVNIASRIEGITEASEIYFTDSVYLAMNKAEVPSSEVGLRRLKGIPEAIKVYSVIQDRHSEQYQRLLKRLRSSTFHDVPVPTTGQRGFTRFIMKPGNKPKAFAGAGVAAVIVIAITVALSLGTNAPDEGKDPPAEVPAAKPVEVDPVRAKVLADYDTVRKAIAEGEMGLALARADAMLKDHATHMESHDAVREVVAAEVKLLVDQGKLSQAMDLVEERRKKRDYVKFDELDRDLLLRWGAAGARKGNYGMAEGAYARLMDRWPGDMEILRAAVSNAGVNSKLKRSRTAFSAALKIAAATDGALEPDVANTMIAHLEGLSPTEERAAQARQFLAARHAPAVKAFEAMLGGEKHHARMNAFLFLKGAGKLDADQEFKFHLKNLVVLKPSDSRERETLAVTLKYIRDASGRPDWQQRKDDMGLRRIESVNALSSSNKMADEVADILVKAFAPEVKESAPEWAMKGYYYTRTRSYQMLPALGLSDSFDHWAYQKDYVILSDYAYQFPYLHKAIAFFASKAGTDRADEAKQVLEESRKSMKDWQDGLSETKRRVSKRNFQVNIDAIEAALAKFE